VAAITNFFTHKHHLPDGRPYQVGLTPDRRRGPIAPRRGPDACGGSRPTPVGETARQTASIACHRRLGVGGEVHANPQLRGVTAVTSAYLVSKSQIADSVRKMISYP